MENGLDAKIAPQVVSTLETAADALLERLAEVRDGEEYRRVRQALAFVLALRRRLLRAAAGEESGGAAFPCGRAA